MAAVTLFYGQLVLAEDYTYVHEDGVDVVGAVVALEGGDVRPEIVRCK